MREVSITKQNGTTIVEIFKDGVSFTKTTSKNRDLEVLTEGVKILPHTEETTLNNEVILISELTDNYGATTPSELLSVFIEKGFFKSGCCGEKDTSDVIPDDKACFHLKDNTLKMCNLSTVFNSTSLGSADSIENRMLVFIEFPEFKVSNIRLKLQLSALNLSSVNRNTIEPMQIQVNTTLFDFNEWSEYSQFGINSNFTHVSLSELSTDVDIYPDNFLSKLTRFDYHNEQEYLLETLEAVYENETPMEVITIVKDGKKGVLILLPRFYATEIDNSVFVNFSDLEITFKDIQNFDESLYKNFAKPVLSDTATFGTYEVSEIRSLTGNTLF